jgi:hypothetical protein
VDDEARRLRLVAFARRCEPHLEPRHPGAYPHCRRCLALRSHRHCCSDRVGSWEFGGDDGGWTRGLAYEARPEAGF